MNFKVGDWVKDKKSGGLSPLLKESDYDKGYFKTTKKNPERYLTQVGINTFELWQPREGEWCWFRTETCQYPELRRFKSMHTFKTGETVYMSMDTEYYEYCEPFIGTLPFLKETK